MNEQEIRALLEREINRTFLKAKLTRIPRIEITLEKPNEKGYLTTPNGKDVIAFVIKNDIKFFRELHCSSTGELWYETCLPIEPIQYTFALGKNKYCYTHLAHHEAVHTVRQLVETKETFDTHDKRFYEIGNILYPDFEYREKNLCKECKECPIKIEIVKKMTKKEIKIESVPELLSTKIKFIRMN